MKPSEFDLNAAIARHARELCRDIRSPKKRKAAVAEYTEHMEDAAYHYMLRGMTDADAFAAAVADLGDREKVQTLLAVAHNGDGWPQWFKYLAGAVGMAALTAGHLLTERDAVRTATGFLLTVLLAVLAWRWMRWGRLFVRALCKRRSAKVRLCRCAREKGLRFTQRKNPYLSLLLRSPSPEWVIDTASRRYIVSLFPTFEPHYVIHFHENGLYAYGKLSGFIARFAFGRMYITSDAELPRGLYRMPTVDFERHHAPDRENIHILLLNPIPFDCDLCRNGHVRRLSPTDSLTAPYGDARACSASDLIRQLEVEM